jgi:hypothetical protein
MAKPSVAGAGTSDVWSSGEYRNYVRDMMTNFGSQYNRRREAETSASDPGRPQIIGRQSKRLLDEIYGSGCVGELEVKCRAFFIVGTGALRHIMPPLCRLTSTIIITLMLPKNLLSTSSHDAGKIDQFETEIIVRLYLGIKFGSFIKSDCGCLKTLC